MRLARAQRLTGRATELGRAEARSAVRGRGVPGGSHVRPTRTTETGSRDDRPHTGATSLQTCLVFSAPRPRPSNSPGIHRTNSGLRPSHPGVRSSAGLGGGGGSLQRTRLAAIPAQCVVGEQQSYAGWIPASPGISRTKLLRDVRLLLDPELRRRESASRVSRIVSHYLGSKLLIAGRSSR